MLASNEGLGSQKVDAEDTHYRLDFLFAGQRVYLFHPNSIISLPKAAAIGAKSSSCQ